MARAAVAAGADGILVEVHPNPDRAFSDGAQSLYPEQFSNLMRELRQIAKAIDREVATPRPEVRGPRLETEVGVRRSEVGQRQVRVPGSEVREA